METFADKFWSLLRPDIGLVPPQIRRILDKCELTGSAALGFLDNDLEQTVTKQFEAIFPQELPPQTFKFGPLQKAVLAAIAQAMSSNGISHYMPTESGSQKDRAEKADFSANPIDPAVEKSNLMAKFQHRYKSNPQFLPNDLKVRFEPTRSGRITAKDCEEQ